MTSHAAPVTRPPLENMTSYPTLSEIDWDKYIVSADVKVDPKGRKTASAKHPDFPHGIAFQVNPDCDSLLKLQFDLRENERQRSSDVTSYDMNLSIADQDLQKHFDEMNNAIIEGASKNSTSWFKNGPKTKKEVEVDFMSPFKKAEKYDPLLKTKVTVSHTEGTKPLGTQIFKHSMQTDSDGNLIGELEKTDISALCRGAQVMLIVKMSQPWFMQSKNFGVTLYCERILVKDAPDECPSQFYFGSKKTKRARDDADLDSTIKAVKMEPSPEEASLPEE